MLFFPKCRSRNVNVLNHFKESLPATQAFCNYAGIVCTAISFAFMNSANVRVCSAKHSAVGT